MSLPTNAAEVAPWAQRVLDRTSARIRDLESIAMGILHARSACPSAGGTVALLNDPSRVAGPYAERWKSHAEQAVASAEAGMNALVAAEQALANNAHELQSIRGWIENEVRRARRSRPDTQYDLSEVNRIAAVLVHTHGVDAN
jgi:hypothetical protein